MREAEAAVTVAEAKVKSAELDLSFTSIDAPLPGRIGRNLVSIGNYVNGGGSGTQTVLTTIVTQDPIQFYFDVSEANAIKYQRLGLVAADKVGQPGAVIELALSDDKGFPHTGKLDFKDNRLDTATSTLRMRAIVDNKSGLFSPGMFGRAPYLGIRPLPGDPAAGFGDRQRPGIEIRRGCRRGWERDAQGGHAGPARLRHARRPDRPGGRRLGDHQWAAARAPGPESQRQA